VPAERGIETPHGSRVGRLGESRSRRWAWRSSPGAGALCERDLEDDPGGFDMVRGSSRRGRGARTARCSSRPAPPRRAARPARRGRAGARSRSGRPPPARPGAPCTWWRCRGRCPPWSRGGRGSRPEAAPARSPGAARSRGGRWAPRERPRRRRGAHPRCRDGEVGDVDGDALETDHGLARAETEAHHGDRIGLLQEIVDPAPQGPKVTGRIRRPPGGPGSPRRRAASRPRRGLRSRPP